MPFVEDLDAFLDVAGGFASDATLDGVAVRILLDTAGINALDYAVATTSPSAVIKSVDGKGKEAKVLVVGTQSYSVRSIADEEPDGAFVRLDLVRV